MTESEAWATFSLAASLSVPKPEKPDPNAGCPADPVPNRDPGVAVNVVPLGALAKLKLGTLEAEIPVG